MSDDVLELKDEVFSTEAPARKVMVRYLQALAVDAANFPVAERDKYVWEILEPFVRLAQPPDDPDLEYLVFHLAGGYLDVMREESLAQEPLEDQIKSRAFKVQVWDELIAGIQALQ